MVPALITTLLFSISAVAGSRLSRLLGGIQANFSRIILATLLLGAYAHIFGTGLTGKGLALFMFSGLIGFGIGDLSLYQAFPLIGSRLCMIMVHCLAAPVAATVEWLWMGTILTPFQILCGIVILVGVATALAPSEHLHLPRAVLARGTAFGLVAALCQAGGALMSRKAYAVAALAGEHPDGITAAYQRICGGLRIAIAAFVIFRLRNRSTPFDLRRAWKWLALNGTAGPALGVSCFQWALSTTPTGIVLPIIALTPVVIIPFSIQVEGEKPSPRSLLGGIIAVIGVAGLHISLAHR
jgi:drug/metabolite transporter (DMT)-like permease